MDLLSLYIITWNLATVIHPPDSSVIEKTLGLDPEKKEDVSDLVIVGFQELKAQPVEFIHDLFYEDPWTKAFRDVLRQYDHVKVKKVKLMGIVMVVFCLREHLGQLRNMETEIIRTGFGGLLGNKGAVAIRLNIRGCSLCFINSHLAANKSHNVNRIAEYKKIIEELTFRNKQYSTIFSHDYVFWFGDLNFRLENEGNVLDMNSVLEMIANKTYPKLRKFDQLTSAMEKKEAFSEFTENFPTFPPTFKFFPNSNEYNPKRLPAWTDRILYRVNNNDANNNNNQHLEVKQLTYTYGEDLMISDHRPVMSRFQLKLPV